MKIAAVQVFPRLNVLAPAAVVRLIVDMGAWGGRAPADLGDAFAPRLLEVLPELADAEVGDGVPPGALFGDPSLRLGHVIARMALLLQRLSGAEASYAAVLAGDDASWQRQDIRYGYWEREVALAAGQAAVAIVAQIAEWTAGPERRQPAAWRPAEIRRGLIRGVQSRFLDLSTAALVREAIRRDIPWRRVSERDCFVRFGHGRFQKDIHETKTSNTSVFGSSMAGDKGASNQMLAEIGVPVPRQVLIRVAGDGRQAAEIAVAAARRLGFPVVVKPVNLGKGKGVAVNLGDDAAVRKAVAEAARLCPVVVVEAFIPGDDHRLLCVGGKMIAAARRVPCRIAGDGRLSVAQLVDAANRDPRRGIGYKTLLAFITLDAETDRVLARQGLDRNSVPAAGQVVQLRLTANISTGGTAVDVTDHVHPDNARAAVRAAAALGIDVAGVDFITTDIGRSYHEVGGAICEVNTSPGPRPHWLGDPGRDVIGPILNTLYPPGSRSRVPIAAITGTNGKTTTTRMVARILATAGRCVGFACTDGAYVDGERLIEGDVAGAGGAALVLHSPEVEVAVLESSRRGIIRRGLAFDWCDVGAVLNVGDDHVGTDGIRDVDDLARIKALVARAARDTVVLNGDDARCVAMAPASPAARLCYVSAAPDNPLVEAHAAGGGMAVTLRPAAAGPTIALHEGGAVRDLLPASELPLAMGGRAMHNVANALFATAIARALGTAPEDIRRGLMALGPGHADTPGRLDLFEQLPFTVVVDFAHNRQKLAAASAFIRQLPCAGRRIVAFAAPGNRTDAQVREFAESAAASAYDHYVCYRRDDRRGRGDDEIPRLLRDGLLAAGIPAEAISAIPDEVAAIDACLRMAGPGDVVALLYTDHERTWKLLAAARDGTAGERPPAAQPA